MFGLVVFHMKGCPHCKAVTGPQSAAKAVGDLLPVYEIESSDPLAKQMGVSSFPTIFFTAPGLSFKFDRDRTPEEIRRFVLEKMGQYYTLTKILRNTKAANAPAARRTRF